MSKLQRLVVCSECGWKAKTRFNSGHTAMFHYHDSMCPSCGNRSYMHQFMNFSVETYRWIPADSVWWKPWTWGRGEWVPLEEKEDERGTKTTRSG